MCVTGAPERVRNGTATRVSGSLRHPQTRPDQTGNRAPRSGRSDRRNLGRSFARDHPQHQRRRSMAELSTKKRNLTAAEKKKIDRKADKILD